MIYFLIFSTLAYAASAFFGTSLDLLFASATMAVMCAWLPRICYGFVFRKRASLIDQMVRGSSEVQPHADDGLTRVANRIWQLSVIVGIVLVAVSLWHHAFSTELSHVSSWSASNDADKRFQMLSGGAFFALLVGMTDSITQWSAAKFEYEMVEQFKVATSHCDTYN